MNARGRRPNSKLALVTPNTGSVETIPRLPAPGDLSDEEAREWHDIINRMPADYFGRESQGLLVQYCRHVVRARKISAMLHQIESGDDDVQLDLSEWDRLTKMQRRETEAIRSLSASMRLSQQSTYGPEKRKNRPKASAPPWES